LIYGEGVNLRMTWGEKGWNLLKRGTCLKNRKKKKGVLTLSAAEEVTLCSQGSFLAIKKRVSSEPFENSFSNLDDPDQPTKKIGIGGSQCALQNVRTSKREAVHSQPEARVDQNFRPGRGKKGVA